MEKKKLPFSLRKFIRSEKARIRREVLDWQEEEKLIKELYQRFFSKENPQEETKKNKK